MDHLPHINAALNATAAILLLVGYAAIRTGRWRAHAAAMISALAISAVFLISYAAYHHHAGERSTAAMPWLPLWLKTVYRAILFPHLVLAIVMLPMIGAAVWRAGSGNWDGHRRIARPTWWVWVYVSITGVVIYWMLYWLFPAGHWRGG